MENNPVSKTKAFVYDLLLFFLFIGGLTLTVFEIDIYRMTMISYVIPSCVWLLTGLFITPFFRKTLELYYNTSSFFLQIIYNIGAWGGIAVYVFMASNYYFARSNISKVQLPIISAGHLAKGRYGCGEPYVDINYYGTNKELIFPCDVPVETYKTVELKIQTGLWGYDIVKDEKLF